MSFSDQALYNKAMSAHQSGRLAEAETHYRQLVARPMGSAVAMYNLALVCASQSKSADALHWFAQAVQRGPKEHPFWLGYLTYLLQVQAYDRFDKVIIDAERAGLTTERLQGLRVRSAVRREVFANPSVNEAQVLQRVQQLVHWHHNKNYSAAKDLAEAIQYDCPGLFLVKKILGNCLLNLQLFEQGISVLKQANRLNPNDADVWGDLAGAENLLHRFAEGESSARKALAINPKAAPAWVTLGNAIYAQTRFKEALGCYEEALRLDRRYALAHFRMGMALCELGRHYDALTSFEAGLAIEPDSALLLCGLTVAYRAIGQYKKSEEIGSRAVELAPNSVEAWVNYGQSLYLGGKIEKAATAFERALELDPDSFEAAFALSDIQVQQKNFHEAEVRLHRLLENPNLLFRRSMVLTTLAGIQTNQNNYSAAIGLFKQAIEVDPSYLRAYSGLHFASNYVEGFDPKAQFDIAKEFGERAARMATMRYSKWSCSTNPEKLRVGLVSGDLHSHPVGYFIESVLSSLSKCALEIIVFQTMPGHDELTKRLAPQLKGWVPIYGLSDDQAAKRVWDQRIHVLIDLSGHTGGHRLPMFALRPAPVQLTWLGYFATTGMKEIDYLLADPWTLLPSEQQFFTEKIYRLPETRLCFSVPEFETPVLASPAISTGKVMFGCFNNIAKITDLVVETWAHILQQVPNSQIMLKASQLGSDLIKQQLRERFSRHGIASKRLILCPSTPRAEYLASYNDIDVVLDPFPYTGGTTTAEALWMGLPVVTLAGERFIARQGVGLLMNAGDSQNVASNLDDYVTIAVRLAAESVSGAIDKPARRETVLKSPVFNAERFAHFFSHALFNMHKSVRGEAV